MNKILLFFVCTGVSIFMGGCAQKVSIRALEPAEIDRASQTKKITVAGFEHDRVGLANKIEANLAGYRIDSQKYFTIVSRSDFDRIISEQKIQNSGLVATATVVEVGNLIGAQAIISGNVGHLSSSDTNYYEERARCADSKCKEMVRYNVGCVKRVVGLSAELKMVDIEAGDIIYADTMSKVANYYHCSDDSRTIPSPEAAGQNLASAMADEFTFKLTPHYRHFDVVLLEDPDLDYTDEQEKLLEVSIEYIKQKRYDKAEKFLFDLIDTTAAQSYVAFYNLGVVKEAEGQYDEAQEYYEKADSLMVKPVAEVSEAYVRIQALIEQHQKTQAQIQR
ncbi:MAG: CsgG/HfaB family protein [Sulfurimonas sp.]|nr:CsgG/HfaB family protein [Sulfurimonas sp.]MDD5202461.1 CsgG/HfaB family protein [Sulfurimonas sp.]